MGERTGSRVLQWVWSYVSVYPSETLDIATLLSQSMPLWLLLLLRKAGPAVLAFSFDFDEAGRRLWSRKIRELEAAAEGRQGPPALWQEKTASQTTAARTDYTIHNSPAPSFSPRCCFSKVCACVHKHATDYCADGPGVVV
ncbi:hypothetical protein LZ31DRAFT_390362 [Colletotrichum somersetense]|nr:hypothetical protein LZ31DRAFT_390362 [Colletotrichum somersetense]